MRIFDEAFELRQAYRTWVRKTIWDLGLTGEDVKEFEQNHPFLDWLDDHERVLVTKLDHCSGGTTTE